MASLRVSAQPAYLIHTRAYRETSLIIDAFSENFGKVSLIAKGVRKKNSATAAHLQPFRELSLSWQGRSELQTLTAVECIKAAEKLPGKAVFCGFYLNELLTFLLAKHDPHPDLYRYYKASLEHLKNPESQELALRYFELKLLEEIGYGLCLDSELSSGEEIVANQLYRYHPEEGATLLNSGNRDSAIHGETLLELHNRALNTSRSLFEAKRLMRSIIGHRLGGRSLKSRELFKVKSLKLEN
jgi:DNA repair protein RecO (recombination protein O)